MIFMFSLGHCLPWSWILSDALHGITLFVLAVWGEMQ